MPSSDFPFFFLPLLKVSPFWRVSLKRRSPALPCALDINYKSLKEEANNERKVPSAYTNRGVWG
jgi:hypothetical protein